MSRIFNFEVTLKPGITFEFSGKNEGTVNFYESSGYGITWMGEKDFENFMADGNSDISPYDLFITWEKI